LNVAQMANNKISVVQLLIASHYL